MRSVRGKIDFMIGSPFLKREVFADGRFIDITDKDSFGKNHNTKGGYYARNDNIKRTTKMTDKQKKEWVELMLKCIDKCETAEQIDGYHRAIQQFVKPEISTKDAYMRGLGFKS